MARCLWPDMFKNQDASVAKAKKGIADCNKAVGRADQLTYHNNQAMRTEKGSALEAGACRSPPEFPAWPPTTGATTSVRQRTS